MKCHICHNETGNSLYSCREFLHGTLDPFVYVRCNSCGCLQITQIPDNIEKYYNSDYYSFNELLEFKKHAFYRRWAYEKRAKYYFFQNDCIGRWLAYFFPESEALTCVDWNPDWKILDVGCGNGFFLHIMSKCGFKDLTGIDPYISEDLHYPTFNIYKNELEKFEGQYDLIILTHSLEHIPDQLQTMQNLHRLLKKDGKIIIRIPLYSEFLFNYYGEYCFSWDAPRHLFLHSQESFKILANSANLSIEKATQETMPYVIIESEKRKRFYEKTSSKIKKSEVLDMIKKLKQFDQWYCYFFVLTKK